MSVYVRYRGHLGNNMLQYCYGRIIAEKMKHTLYAKPIEGFPATEERIDGMDYEIFIPIRDANSMYTVPKYGVPVEQIAKDNPMTNIDVHGWFQKYEFYKDHGISIKNNWMNPGPIEKAPEGDVVMHVRLGDYFNKLGWHLPIQYYEDCLESMEYDNVWICTDEPKHEFIKHFTEKYDAKVFDAGPTQAISWSLNPNEIADLKFMMGFDKIIMSRSTYSWWAAFLSDATDICFPVPDHGFWSPDDDTHALFPYDQPRFRKVHCVIKHEQA